MPAIVLGNTEGKGEVNQLNEGPLGFLPEDRLREICEKHYNQILPIMAEKVHQEKLQGVQTRLTYGESSRQKAQTKEKTQLSESESCDRKRRTKKRQPARTEETYLSENKHDRGGHWKSKSKKQKSIDEEDLSQSWLCEETDPFTARIRNFKVPKRTRMPTNVKTYDGTGDPEDHLKIFDTVKYIKDPVEIHHIKQREGESMEAFMKRFKAESMHVNGAPKCMRISVFMHGITNPDLIKRLNDNIPKSVDEMMSVTTAFLRGEVAVANQSRKKALPA
ncbi:hypothetical protein Tco_1368110 [Tanacetum coccineum]